MDETRHSAFALTALQSKEALRATLGLLGSLGIILFISFMYGFAPDERAVRYVNSIFPGSLSEFVVGLFNALAVSLCCAYLAVVNARRITNSILSPLMPHRFAPRTRTKMESRLHWISSALFALDLNFLNAIGLVSDIQTYLTDFVGPESSAFFTLENSLIISFVVTFACCAIVLVVGVKKGVRRPLLNWAAMTLLLSIAPLVVLCVAIVCLYSALTVAFLAIALLAILVTLMVAPMVLRHM